MKKVVKVILLTLSSILLSALVFYTGITLGKWHTDSKLADEYAVQASKQKTANLSGILPLTGLKDVNAAKPIDFSKPATFKLDVKAKTNRDVPINKPVTIKIQDTQGPTVKSLVGTEPFKFQVNEAIVPADLKKLVKLTDNATADDYLYQHAKIEDVDIHKLGSFSLRKAGKLVVTDRSFNQTVVKFAYSIVDSQAPTIKSSDLTLTEGDKFDPLSGVSVTDNFDKKPTVKAIDADKVDVNKAGDYSYKLQAEDQSHNVAETSRKVTIKAKPAPVTQAAPAAVAATGNVKTTAYTNNRQAAAINNNYTASSQPVNTAKPTAYHAPAAASAGFVINGQGFPLGGAVSGGANTPLNAIYTYADAPLYYLADRAGVAGGAALSIGIGGTIQVGGRTYTVVKIRDGVHYTNPPSDIWSSDFLKLQVCLDGSSDPAMRIIYAQ